MAKIFMFSGYVIDPDGSDECTELAEFFKSCPDIIVKHVKIVEKDIGEWDDNNPLNLMECPIEECEKYFAK